jgi:hypothetical protein
MYAPNSQMERVNIRGVACRCLDLELRDGFSRFKAFCDSPPFASKSGRNGCDVDANYVPGFISCTSPWASSRVRGSLARVWSRAG